MAKKITFTVFLSLVVFFSISAVSFAQGANEEQAVSQEERNKALSCFEQGYLMSSSDKEQAQASYKKALEIDPGLGEYFLNEGINNYFLDRTYEAIDNFQKAKELFTLNGDLQHLSLAEEYLDKLH